MANKRIDQLSAATSAAQTDVFFVGNPTTGALSKIRADQFRKIMYEQRTGNSFVSLVSGQTVYWGAQAIGTTSTTDSFFGTRQYCHFDGTINVAYVYAEAFGTAGSGESWSMYIRVNATTDYLIGSVASTSAVRSWSNTSLSITITAGDYFCIKMVNPSWATTPTSNRFNAAVYLEY